MKNSKTSTQTSFSARPFGTSCTSFPLLCTQRSALKCTVSTLSGFSQARISCSVRKRGRPRQMTLPARGEWAKLFASVVFFTEWLITYNTFRFIRIAIGYSGFMWFLQFSYKVFRVAHVRIVTPAWWTVDAFTASCLLKRPWK